MVAALLFGRAPLCKAQVNELRADGISSLQVVVGDNWLSMPVMALNGGDAVNIDFDDPRTSTDAMSTPYAIAMPTGLSLTGCSQAIIVKGSSTAI